MYVCVCKGVTENVIREAVDQGAERMRDLKACLGVTAQCGICACHAKQVLEQALIQKSPDQHLASNPAFSRNFCL
jgi:bacterioferritin-associated ferredoxin